MKKILLFLLLIPFTLNAITPIHCCGFECGLNGTTGQHWGAAGAGATFSTSTKRNGDRSIRLQASGSSVQIENTVNVGAAIAVVRLYLYFTTLPNIDDVVVLMFHDGVRNGSVMFKASDSKLYAYANGTFSSTGITIATGQWYRIDLRVNATGATWLVDLQVDGSATTQASGSAAASTITTLRIGTTGYSTTYDYYADDVVISGTTGDYPIGPGFVNHFVPTADGSHSIAGASDFEIGTGGTDITNASTTAYQLIDDVPLQSGAPGTTDFINMIAPPNATDYTEHIFGPAPGISTPTQPPRAVVIIAGIAHAGTGLGNMEIRMNDNGTMGTLYTATQVAGVTTIIFKTAHISDPPSAASTWVIGGGGNGDFTDFRIRFGSPAAVDANPDQYLTSIMIEAEFEEIAATVPGTPSDKRHTTLGVGLPAPQPKK